MHVMSSSLRESSLEQTLDRARQMARRFHITRVTDTTRLDRVGIPVFASIRPGAIEGSLCVNAGKGLRLQEAQVGAYMESIEFALAELRNTALQPYSLTARDLEAHPAVRYRLVDLCPRWGVRIEPDQPIACVDALDEVTGETVPLPAELVFHPYPENPGASIYGTSTNGLASGNSPREASVHALCEVIERHVQTFHSIKSSTMLVDMDEAPSTIAPLLEKIGSAGLRLVLRYAEGPGRLPFFNAFMLEEANESTIAIVQGMGLHPRKEIAAVRAITEAAQSRLTFIHGGRDDITQWMDALSPGECRMRVLSNRRSRAAIQDSTLRIEYSSIPDRRDDTSTIPEAWRTLTSILLDRLAKQILSVELTQPGDPLSVVKIVVPGLEYYEPFLKRTGPRLLQYIDEL